MNIRVALADELIAQCNFIEARFEAFIVKLGKKKVRFGVYIAETLSQELSCSWEDVVRFIAYPRALEQFIHAELGWDREDDEAETIDAEEMAENDPFTSGLLTQDEDGRVHFRRDLDLQK